MTPTPGRSRPGRPRTGRRSPRSARRSRSPQYLSQPGGFRIGLFGKHDGSGDDEVQVDAFNVVAGTADPQTPGDDCGGDRAVPAERRVRRHGARREVGGRQPDAGRAGRRRRQPDADHRPGRRLRRQLHGPEHPPAGGARGPVDGDDEVRPHGDHGQRPGGRPGDLRPAEPELLRQGDAAVQERRRSHTPGNQPGKWIERTLTTNGNLEQQLRRQLPEHRGADAADERPVDPRALRRHERDHRVLVRRRDVQHAGAAGPGHRVRAERRHQDRPVRQARRQRPGDERQVRLVQGRGRELRASSPTRRRRAPRTRSIRPRRTATTAGTPRRSRSRSTRPTTTAARASTRPSTASRATRSGPRTGRRSPSTTRAGTRSSTARPTTRATPSRPSRSPSRSTRPPRPPPRCSTARRRRRATTAPVEVDLDADRRRRVGRPRDRDPRRRRRVAAVRGGGDDPQLRGRPRAVGAGRARRAQLDARTAASPAPPAAWACRGTRSRTTATSR